VAQQQWADSNENKNAVVSLTAVMSGSALIVSNSIGVAGKWWDQGNMSIQWEQWPLGMHYLACPLCTLFIRSISSVFSQCMHGASDYIYVCSSSSKLDLAINKKSVS